jgi:single-strand DNA-binding protein
MLRIVNQNRLLSTSQRLNRFSFGFVNRAILVGNVGAKPEVKDIGNDRKLIQFPLATNEQYKNKDGAIEKNVQWHQVKVFVAKDFEFVDKFVEKGTKVHVEGKIEYRIVENEKGKRTYTDIVVGQRDGSVTILSPKAEQPESQ